MLEHFSSSSVCVASNSDQSVQLFVADLQHRLLKRERETMKDRLDNN